MSGVELGVAFAVVVVAGFVAAYRFRGPGWDELVHAMARRYAGLRVDRSEAKPVLVGRFDGVPLRAMTYRVQTSDGPADRVEVRATVGLPTWLRAEHGAPRPGDAQLGDRDFDPYVRVHGGDAAKVAALLDVTTRSALAHAVREHRFVLSEGELVCDAPGIPRPDKLQRIIDAAVAVGRAAARARGAANERLERIIRFDPVAEVRRNAFMQLRGRAGRQGVAEVARHVVRTADPELVLVAADALRDDDAVAGLTGLVRRPGLAQRGRALHLLCELGRPPAEADAIAFSADDAPPVRAAACRALGERGTPACFQRLAALLDDEDTTVAVAAAAALGEHGGLDAVEPLHARAEGRGPAVVRDAARAAIVAIHGRGAGAAGQLSLAEPDDGGRLAIADEPA